MTPARVPPPPPGRTRIGSTPTIQSRLAAQRPRPVAVRLYATLLGDAGPLGAPARRRSGAFLLRSLPAAVAVAGAALVVLRVFELEATGWAQLVALAALAVLLAGVMWRRGARILGGVPAGYREQLELGALVVVTAAALVQATAGGAGEPPLQPVLYLVMAFLVAFLAWPVGLAMVLLAVALEFGPWWQRGADPATLAVPLAHVGFLATFSLLSWGVLKAKMAAADEAGRDAEVRLRREKDQKAAEYRLLAPRSDGGGEEVEGGPRWIDGAVQEIEAAVRELVDMAVPALHAETCAVYLLSTDDQWLRRRECRAVADTVVAEVPAGEGALGGAVRRATPVRLHGEVKAATYHGGGYRPGALLAVPLIDRRGGFVRGVVVADRVAPVPFTDEDERVLVNVASQILRAVASERRQEGLKQTRDEAERVYQAIERLSRETKVDGVTKAALEVSRSVVRGVEFGAVTLVEEDGKLVRHKVVRTWPEEKEKSPIPEGFTFGDDLRILVCSVVHLKHSLPAPGQDATRRSVFDVDTRLEGFASIKVIPLAVQPLSAEEAPVLGTLVLGSSRTDAFTDDVVRLLELLARQAAETIQRAWLFEKTESLATTDGLTGLLNHRTFQEGLDDHLLAAQRHPRQVSLLLCDIDHFKSVNDTYGHPVGDQVLRGVAEVLKREARGTDLVARYGGEEFAVVMPETDQAGALVIAERIRERVGQLVTQTSQGPLKVTMSLGIATFPGDGALKAELVEKADACLYFAKRHGRNQCVTAARLKGGARAPG